MDDGGMTQKKTARRSAGPGGKPAPGRDSGGVVQTGNEVDLGPLPGFIGYPLRRAQLTVFEDFMRCVGKLGLRPGQFSALAVIGTTPGLKQAQVANALGIKGTNFTTMINELEARGLVERRARDKRSHALHLTPDGRKLVDQAIEVQRRQEKKFDKALGPGGREQLVALLHKLDDAVRSGK